MGWTVSYQVVRGQPLDSGELARVAELVRATNADPLDGESFDLAIPTSVANDVIARGWTKISMDTESADADRLCEALTALQQLLPGARVLAVDDFGLLGWDDKRAGFALGARTRRAVVDDSGGSAWRSILELVPVDAPAPPADLTHALAALATGAALGDAIRTDERVIDEALTALLAERADRTALAKLLAACDPDAVARVGLGRYAGIQHEYAAREAIGAAFERVTDVGALAPAFVEMWRAPKGTYYYGDLPLHGAFAIAIAREPLVRDALIDSIARVESGSATSDIARRCAERAALLLGASADPIATRRLAAIVRRWRGEQPDFAIEHYIYLPALEGLGRGAQRSAVPTLLLALDSSPCTYRAHAHAIEGAALGDPALALPIMRCLLERGIGLRAVLDAAAKLGAGAAPLVDAITPYLAYPRRSNRIQARNALEAIGVEVSIADPGDPDPETLVLHPDRDVRHEALRAIHDRRDRSLFHALAIGETIDAALRAKVGDSSLPFSWHEWKDILPDEIRQARAAARLAWATSDAATALGPQRMLPGLADARDRKPEDVVAGVELRLRLDTATRDALIAAETALDP